jgi:hypothetical protein
MHDPFGEEPTPWIRRMRRKPGAEKTPRRYMLPVTVIAGIVGFSLPPTHGHVGRVVLSVAFTGLPWLVDALWQRRRRHASRRASEQLLFVPDAGTVSLRAREVNRATP